MKKLTAFIFLCSVVALSVSAQHKLYYEQNPKFIEWVNNPKITPVPPEYANEPAIYLLNDVNINYKYEGRDTTTFYTRHVIVKVLDERGIEMFNKIRIPLNSGTRAAIKARTIDPSGKVHDIDKEMIKQTKDESGRFMISIALEGVEKNAEIEYTIKTINHYTLFNEIFYQFSVPTVLARFELSYPKELIFEMKSLNGFPPVKDTLIEGRKRIAVKLNDIPGIEDEPNSFVSLHRMAIEYRASYVTTGNNEMIKQNTWDAMARKMYDTYYKCSERERKAVNKYLSDLGVHANGKEVDNIKKIEQGIKTQITLYPMVDYDERQDVKAFRTIKSVSVHDVGWDENRDMLDTIISKKAATAYGYLKLFAACLTQAGVKHELGVAGDRSEHGFDTKFESWIGLDHHLFYFPNQKKFMDPENIYLRYPVIPEEMVGGKGVFCTIPQKGEITGGISAIRTITPLPIKETGEKIAASVSFNPEMDASVDVAYSWSGYLPTKLREELPFYPKDKMKDLITSLIPFADKPDDVEKYTISNEGFDNYYSNKPLELYASVHPERLVSKADKQYLFRLGAIIGPQFNLYAEDKRKLPVDFFYPFYESYTITVNIPKGYKIVNPETARISDDYLNDNMDQVINFSSDYKLVKDKENGDKLVVTVSEYFNQLHFSLNEYGRYRKVINTAADFNKVTLVMEPEKVMAHHRRSRKGMHHATQGKPLATNTKQPAAHNKAMPANSKPAPIKVGGAPIKVAPPKKQTI